MFSGNANNGTNAGFGYTNTNNRSSNANANNGFRLYRQKIYLLIWPSRPCLTWVTVTAVAGKIIFVLNSVSKLLKALLYNNGTKWME